MDLFDALERTYARADEVVAGLRDDDMGKPTPCPEWDVHRLLAHMVGAIAQFPALLRSEQPDWGNVPPLDDRVREFRAAVAANLEAWRVPGALDTPSSMLEGMKVIDFNLGDAVVHTWDLARATGQDPDLDPVAVRAAYDIWVKAPLDLSRKFGAFGPEVAVPADASITDRLVGLLGRRP